MTINNITGGNSLHSNCQPDQCSSSMLTNIHDFITECKGQSKSNDVSKNPNPMNIEIDNHTSFGVEPKSQIIGPMIASENQILVDIEDDEDLNTIIVFEPETNGSSNVDEQLLESRIELINRGAISNASSRICQKMFKFTKCVECKQHFELMDETSALLSVERVLTSLNIIIPDICHQDSLKQKLIKEIPSVQIHFIGCSDHNEEIIQKIKNLCVAQVIQSFSDNINNILSGKIKTLPDNPNYLQKLAYEERMRKKYIGKYSDIYNEQ